ncbi:serine/threonine-protein kinase Sgk2 [Lineolata rhizophorae]|uniref:non-specific serine/threonine protein kinase n=1 Tax=Lineolata rhizophorae TaxID=578093 RepID=A0A6A6P4D1_9PEZI|nr:serine/threonine-protein kinase Sgk2 [Lineolata rhizophorae]
MTASRHDRDRIARHPLDNSLHHLHKPLCDAEQSSTPTSSLNATDDTQNSHRKAISQLLYVLLGTEAALDLRSKTSCRDVAAELSSLFGRVRDGEFKYDSFRPLVRLVIQKKSDFEIWSAVFDLITKLSRVTPFPSVPTGFDDTPITHTSASQQGSEQTRRLVEARVFEEIRHCTYWDVGGFFEKYFEGKDWTRRASDVYESMKGRHVSGKWANLPNSPTQTEVLDWLFQLQNDLLSKERRRYYTIKVPKELTGAEAQRQIDLIVKRNTGELSDTKHDWRDIEVIGELKASNNNKKATLVQLGRYVRDVFACQPTRRYVHAFTICGRKMDVWIFDRSGCYSPGPFDIHDEPERFVQVIASYTMMNEDELGLDTFIERDGGCRFIHIEQGRRRLQLEPEPLTRQRAIVCRGTSCYLTGDLDSEGWSYVTKFSWTSDKRKPEADLLGLANQRNVEGIAKLVSHHRITSINEMRTGVTFTKPHSFRGPPSAASSFSQSFSRSQPPSFLSRSFSGVQGLSIAEDPSKKRKSDVGQGPSKRPRSNSQTSSQHPNEVTYDVDEAQGTSLLAPNNGAYDNRIFRCLVISPAGRAIHKYESLLELLGALRDAIRAHRSLYLEGNILHRDISENNIIITDPKKTGGFMGMLIDLDLAKELGSGRSGARCRTGTMEFMAIDVLLGISHTYRHDLESFFYVLLWQCARRGWEFLNKPMDQSRSKLRAWYTGNYEDIANVKIGHVNKAEDKGFGFILREFPQEFDCVKPLCRELRGLLFPIHKDVLFTGTPNDPKLLYGPIIEAFDKAISDIKATEG